LTNLLLPSLETNGGASVVTTSSRANRMAGRIDLAELGRPRRAPALAVYAEAKLANVLMTRSLHQRFHARRLSPVAFHPGRATGRPGRTASPRSGARGAHPPRAGAARRSCRTA